MYGTTGRPNWSVARMLGLCILREMANLASDQAVLDALAFDARFQHALGLEPGEAYLSRRSFGEFRARLQRHDPDGAFVEQLLGQTNVAAIAAMGLSTSTQRIDSTFVRSNIALRGRTALLAQALERLLDYVTQSGREALLDAHVRDWFATEVGWESSRSFEDVSRGLCEVLELFRGDKDIASSEAYRTASEVFSQHVLVSTSEDDEPPPSGASPERRAAHRARVKARERASKANESAPAATAPGSASEAKASAPAATAPGTASEAKASAETVPSEAASDAATAPGTASEAKASAETVPSEAASDAATAVPSPTFSPSTVRGVDRIQSLHDRDARLGKKGTGYLVHLAETSGNAGKPELITHVAVVPANVNDSTMTGTLVEALDAKSLGPKTVLVDAGYTSGDHLLEREAAGAELVGPVMNPWKHRSIDELLTRNDFEFDAEGLVLRCPEGNAPIRHAELTTSSHPDRQLHAVFDKATCHACPRWGDCPVRDKSNRPVTQLMISPAVRLRDARLVEQQRSEFQQCYQMRSGIEATNSELKRAHGMGRLTVRGRRKVRARVLFKVIACNTKRWGRYHQRTAAKAA